MRTQLQLTQKDTSKLYQDVFERAPLGIYTLDAKGKIESFNPKMMELAGAIDCKAVIGLDALTLPTYKEVGLDKLFKEGLAGKGFDTEVRYVSYTSKKETFRHYRGVPIFGDGNKVERLLLMVEDITKRKLIEKMKTEFVTIASHQLKTPLAGIRWSVELLLGDKLGPLNGKQQELAEKIRINNERMIELVNNLLNLSAIETGEAPPIRKSRIDIIDIIKQAAEDSESYAAGKNVEITVCKDLPKELELLVDKDKIAQVFRNVIHNAVQYSKTGGRVEITCDTMRNEVVFSISDSGIGIPKDEQERVFQKFFRGTNAQKADDDGTGLGLHISKAIVEACGGEVSFESHEGRGTTFYISLPK